MRWHVPLTRCFVHRPIRARCQQATAPPRLLGCSSLTSHSGHLLLAYGLLLHFSERCPSSKRPEFRHPGGSRLGSTDLAQTQTATFAQTPLNLHRINLFLNLYACVSNGSFRSFLSVKEIRALYDLNGYFLIIISANRMISYI